MTGSTDGAPNHRDVPATSKGKGRAHDKLPDIADRSTGTRPKTRPASPKLRDDADGDSTDATFYSAVSIFWRILWYLCVYSPQDSQLEGPRHSPDTSLVASQPMATSTRACLDYVNGRCHREVCRYSHNVDREQMRLQYQEVCICRSWIVNTRSHDSGTAHKSAPTGWHGPQLPFASAACYPSVAVATHNGCASSRPATTPSCAFSRIGHRTPHCKHPPSSWAP